MYIKNVILLLFYFRDELKEKYEGKISKELSGPTYEVLAKIMKVIINRRVTGPGDFLGYVFLHYLDSKSLSLTIRSDAP